MSAFLVMTKNNLKLLVRNIAFLICLLILPFGASSLLMLQNSYVGVEAAETKVIEINRICSLAGDNGEAVILFIDTANDPESKFIVDFLADDSTMMIVHLAADEMTAAELDDMVFQFNEHGYITDLIYLPPDFGREIAVGRVPEVLSFKGRNDDRAKLADAKINSGISILLGCVEMSSSEDEMISAANKIIENRPKVNVSVIDDNEKALTFEQNNKLTVLGYSIAVLGLAFLLSGAFIANLITTERENKTLIRINLSGISMMSYTAAKAITGVVTAIIQTGVSAVAVLLLVGTDIGIPFGTFIVFIGAIGIIFNLLSITFGIYFRSSLATVYSVVGVWMISNLLSKLYFSFLGDDVLPSWWQKGSLLTPQRWVMICSKMIMLGEDGAVGIFFTAIAGFVVVILSACVIGTRLNTADE